MTEFEKNAAQRAAAQEHAEEIKNTRIGGLGGSDAKMVYKIGLQGLSALTQSDSKRLAVMLGMIQQEDWGGNAYTNAGHLFEDFIEHEFVLPQKLETEDKEGRCCYYEREQYIEQPLAVSFKTFAHADFVSGTNRDMHTVLECKYSQKTTEQVVAAYSEQLQWYYMLGKKRVVLIHGSGSVEPFEPQDVQQIIVERDETVIGILLEGIKILDKAIAEGWRPTVADKCNISETPSLIRDAFAKLSAAKRASAVAKVAEDEAKAVLTEFMQGLGYSEINGYEDEDGTAHKVTLSKPKQTTTFDRKAFASAIEKQFADRADVVEEIRKLMQDATKMSIGASAFSYR